MKKAVLLLSCPDARGIVAEVSHFIFTYGGNILDSSQHNDRETATFFMRVEWDLANFALPEEKIVTAFEPIAIKFAMDYRIELSSRRPKVAILVSRYEHCLYDILLRNTEGEIDCDIAMIISNHTKARETAEYFRIPFHHVSVSKDAKREAEDHQIQLLKENSVDLVVLARYMQILTPAFVSEFAHRIINIHHSFLPAFAGAKPYHKAFARGVKIIGATSHYVTAELDEGPIIEQDVARISHRYSIPDLVQTGRNLERVVLSRAVKLHLENRILVFRNKTIVFD